MKPVKYATETALCADFLAWVKSEAGQVRYGRKLPCWTPYAETAGWDILLVAEDGTQIGVQAKLRFNLKVIEQALPGSWCHWHDRGPDFRAILVPDQDASHASIASALGLMLFTRSHHDYYRGIQSFTPGLDLEHSNGGWHWWSPKQREALPEFVPDVAAGASGPVQLTKWKISALRIAATLQVRGFVTKADFMLHQIDPRRWTGPGGWIKPGTVPGQFVRGELPDFAGQHPVVYGEVLASVRADLEAREGARGG